MIGLDLVLEAEPAITNKVKVGAELTLTAMSYIYYVLNVNRNYIW